jgi:glycosyltransferase involved in cell wall biosynthesis
LAETLAALGFETHLWFVGDPDLPGHETRGCLRLHRWAQWVSRHHPSGVYDGELRKQPEFAASLPPCLMREALLPYVRNGGRAVVLAEEWHTVDAVLHLHWLLERAGVRKRAAILWNANNTFGFERIEWDRLARAASITTVSRYMKYRMWDYGVDPLVIPNGLPADAFDPPDRLGCAALRRRFRDRTVLAKMARWDPDKRWLGAVEIVAEMKREGWRPLLIARGGAEAHGEEVGAAIRARGLRRIDREWTEPGANGLLNALRYIDGADVVNLRSHVDPESRRMLFRGSGAVLANSAHEPFGLVGLETMAVGGVACTGCSGEEYAVPGQNALVLETGNPREFLGMFRRLRTYPHEALAVRRAGRSTAKRFAWPEIVQRILVPKIEFVEIAGALRRAASSVVLHAPLLNLEGCTCRRHSTPAKRRTHGLRPAHWQAHENLPTAKGVPAQSVTSRTSGSEGSRDHVGCIVRVR